MKQNSNQTNTQSKQAMGNRHRPENRDDLDSRSNEEQDNKGDDETHNKKELKNDRKKVKND